MTLGIDDVKAIAHLARIAIDEETLPTHVKNLSSVLALADQLKATDTDGVEPMAHPLDAVQRLRDDVVTESDQREKFQSIAPAVQDGLYLVPKVVE
ncbi:Asp-tRNA(Asn)/Glu-tRNA(Gln) amidotransferase subunit GatC [Granulosicoccaceae sp. 1_MG-2023]|nr:Asp-tRNA(Asn)/Glu-tRNA(Gln) amidotransferase subunit GatC [Granulosicoccaceae sp. 1_MG-2023]